VYRDISKAFLPPIPLSDSQGLCRKLLPMRHFFISVPLALRGCLLVTLCGLLLAGCEQLGIEDPAKIAEAREAEGRAVGGACRHSGRALEDCYKLNAKAQKSAIYAGWRDMDAYMRENNIAVVPSGGASSAAKKAPADMAPMEKPATADKPAAAPSSAVQPAPAPAPGRKSA
jgi:hypothetical protein